jgi:hypothetical protein
MVNLGQHVELLGGQAYLTRRVAGTHQVPEASQRPNLSYSGLAKVRIMYQAIIICKKDKKIIFRSESECGVGIPEVGLRMG